MRVSLYFDSNNVIPVQSYPQYSKSDPRFYRSNNKKPGSPLIFFVHFYGGNQRILKRHIQFVNDLGYDAFAFNMPSLEQKEGSLRVNGQFGLKHLYADMIGFYLKQIPGSKIIYSFSNPSAAAIEVIAHKANEVGPILGLICDSGPSGRFLDSAWNLAKALQGKSKFSMAFFLLALGGSWSWKFHSDLARHLNQFPKDFPILSIRGGQDLLIPPWHIEEVFSKHSQINLTTHLFPFASHLDALKKFSSEYEQVTINWFSKI